MATKKSTKKEQKSFDFRTIQSFEDACKKEGINPELLPDLSVIPEEFAAPMLAYYKLLIIFKAINNGWTPDWNKFSQYKYYPWFSVLSSGFGFSGSYCNYDYTVTAVGSRLCTDTSEKALYIRNQFEKEYTDLFLYSK